MSSPSLADDSQNAPKKNAEAPGIMKFFKSLGKTNSDECAEHVKTATFSALGTPKQKEKIAPKTRKKAKNVPRVTRSRRRVKPAARNAKKPKVSRGSGEGPDKDSVYDILDISDDAEEVTIIEYSEFLKQQQISKETKNDTCGNAKAPVEETVAEQVQKTAPVSVITGYFKPISEEPQSQGKAKRPSHGKVKLSDLTSSRPKRACTMLRNSFDALQQEMLLEMFDRKARRNLCKVDVLESQHPMRLRHKRDSFEQFFVPPEEEPTKSPRSSKHKKKKRSKSQSEVAQTLAEHENTNEVYTSTIIEERSDFKCPRLRITRVSKDHDDTAKDPVDDLEAQDIIVSVKEEELTNPKPEVAQVDEARVSFLQSGIPEKLRRETDAANTMLKEFIRDSANFPTVSHVRQLTDDVMWTLPSPEMANLRTTLTSIPTITGKLELGSFTQCKRSERWQPQPAKPFDQQQVLTTLQQEHPKLAIVKMFERYQHRTRVSQNSQNANSVTEEVDRIAVANNKGKVAMRGKRSRRGTARPNSKRNSVNATDLNNQHADEVSSNSSSTEESSLMWTEKFQPEGAIDIIGNDRAVQELRSWLHHWKQKPRQDDPAVRVPKRKRTDSATDEDYVADEFCHAQLLVGPSGIGKTATVYALANEIGFEVIEVNASSKRPGKQVLSQLQEATQSHSVNNGPSCDSQGIANYFQKVNNKPANSQQQDKSNLKKYPMGSLILFKDVDIVFEEDEGFINAVNSFIDISKRPIIMTTSDQRFVIANRLSAIHEEIRFEVPNWDLVILHMQLMSLAEGLHVPTEELMSTTPPWKIDIRHAILALQYRYMSATKPQIAEATVVKEPAGNSQRRRKRPTKQQAVQSPPKDTCKDPPAEDVACWDLPRDATLQTGRILTLTTGKPLVTDNIVGVCWSSGINFTMGPSKHVLEHQDGTNNTSPGDTVRVDGKRSAASSTLMSEFADRASAVDVIQWQTLRQTPDVATNASRDFIRPGTSDVAVHDYSESWCTKACGQDISAYLRTLNWEDFSKLQRDNAESHDGVHLQWTRDTLQTQISKARKDVGATVKQCSLQASHALDLDYMPWLKVICRAEGIRHVSNKKRGGGRYLHYLDSINLSLQPGTLSHLTNS